MKLGPQQIDELSVRASRSEEYQTLCLENQSVERWPARVIESRFSPTVIYENNIIQILEGLKDWRLKTFIALPEVVQLQVGEGA